MPRTRATPLLNGFNFVMLFVVWIMLTNNFTTANLLLALLLAWAIPLLVGGLQSETSRVRRPIKALQYVAVLLWDIVVSNLTVARQVLGNVHKLQPGFLAIPLELDEDLPITLLASTISLTPGTVSTEIAEDKRVLYVHALHVTDEQAMIAQIKGRYEKPLKEIFAC